MCARIGKFLPIGGTAKRWHLLGRWAKLTVLLRARCLNFVCNECLMSERTTITCAATEGRRDLPTAGPGQSCVDLGGCRLELPMAHHVH